MDMQPEAASSSKAAAPASAGVITLRKPYLLFLGTAQHPVKAKTAFGLRDWVREDCLGQLCLPDCKVDLGLPELDVGAAAAAGAGSLVLGVTPPGGRIQAAWTRVLLQAAEAGLDIVSGLHTPLAEVPGLSAAAERGGARLVDVRRPPPDLPRAAGTPRSGKRVLTVGTDCALGKKYTALALARGMRDMGVDADFRATGQTGIMIAGAGIAIDAVVADFIAGAVECIAPAADPAHWDVVEGQGAILHPAYAGVTLGLLHGAQPDALVLCHDPTRTHLVSWPTFPVPSLRTVAEHCLQLGRLTNPGVRLAAVSLNTSGLEPGRAAEAIAAAAALMDVPCFDPLRDDLQPAIARILGH